MTALSGAVERVRRAPPILIDGAMGTTVLVVGTIEVTIKHDLYPATRPGAVALVAVAALGVALRRRNPWITFVLVWLAQIVGEVTKVGYGPGFAPALAQGIMLYTLAERRSARASLLALTVAIGYPFLRPPLTYSWREVLFYFLFAVPGTTLPWFAGRAQARRRAVAADLARSADQLVEERDQLARSAVTAERSRIARELHQLVSRGVEWMNAETRAARRLLGDPERASRSIGAIEEHGRRTLVDMRRLLMVLRAEDAGATGSFDGELPTDQPAFEDAGQWEARLMGRQPDIGTWLVRRIRRWWSAPWAVDGSVVLGLAILAVAERLLPPYWGAYLRRPIDLVLMSFMLAALLVRRARPLLVFLVVMVIIFGWVQLWEGGANTADLSLVVALYSVAAFRGPWWGVLAILVNVVAYYPGCRDVCAIGTAAGDAFVVVAGVAVYEGRRLIAQLQDQTDLIRRTREERVRMSVVEERSRIARDVHDMVAHGVTLMVIQAGAARWLAETDAGKADHALASVERVGREALRELHMLVGTLGSPATGTGDALPLDGQLTIRTLVDQEVRAGTHVELTIRGEPRSLDPGLEVSLYRIVQEALTNVRKHAPGARAWVDLRYLDEWIEIEVTDQEGLGGGQRGSVPGAGQGLVGIAERAALFGGRAEFGPTEDRGFRVKVYLGRAPALV